MAFERHVISSLKKWKEKGQRKPLIIRGARQVGKTTVIRQFSRAYKHSILLNLELTKDSAYFRQHDHVSEVLGALQLAHNILSTELKNTLLFIDEIQEVPEAIAMLRYFYEDFPELHVIAAGSLLEHAIRNIKSFPVGRIEYLYMYPLNFQEYLGAMNHSMANDALNDVPIKEHAHQTLMNFFNTYAIIGGMPEIIQNYINTKTLADLLPIYESIWSTYKDDIQKYASNDTEVKVIRHIISTAHLYLDQRVKFEKFGNSNYRSREVGEAFRSLDDAKVIQLIYPSTDVESPIKPDLRKRPRMQFLDTGLVNNELKIQAEMLAMDDLSEAYKGALIPHLITQELISLNTISDKQPHFWVRKKKGSDAEVDLIIQYKNHIIPIEIKSGKTGKLKSLHQFIEATNHHFAVRIYGGKFSVEDYITQGGKSYKLMNLPYYLGTKIPEYIAWFIEGK